MKVRQMKNLLAGISSLRSPENLQIIREAIWQESVTVGQVLSAGTHGTKKSINVHLTARQTLRLPLNLSDCGLSVCVCAVPALQIAPIL